MYTYIAKMYRHRNCYNKTLQLHLRKYYEGMYVYVNKLMAKVIH